MSKSISGAEKLLNLVFPEKCISCGGYIVDENRPGDFLLAHFFCRECAEKKGFTAEVPFSVIRAVQYVITADPRKAFAFELKEPASTIFSHLCERFLLTHIEHDLPTLNYYKVLDSTD